jgi:hypothetical protein
MRCQYLSYSTQQGSLTAKLDDMTCLMEIPNHYHALKREGTIKTDKRDGKVILSAVDRSARWQDHGDRSR